jgi:hypothetical protein
MLVVHWKARVKALIPGRVLNETLLTWPALYRTSLVSYETTLRHQKGLDDLMTQFEAASLLDGNIIECGSSRCGASVIMANWLRRRGLRKTIYACDSFPGFDLTELRRERQAGMTTVSERAFTSTSLEYVKRKLRALDVDDVVIPVKGYFADTLPHLNGTWCFALIDCDLRKSLVYCAEIIWPNLCRGGRLVFDNYTHPDFAGAKQGTDEFVESRRHEIADHGLLHRLYFVTKK